MYSLVLKRYMIIYNSQSKIEGIWQLYGPKKRPDTPKDAKE